jgi:hypothetical protein
VSNLKPFAIRLETLPYDNVKEFAANRLIDEQHNISLLWSVLAQQDVKGSHCSLTASKWGVYEVSRP